VTYDVVVIGGGAAGLSAALMLARSRRRVAVVDSGQPRNSMARHLHGFLSRDGATPSLLLETGRDEVRSFGGDLLQGRVVDITRIDESGFAIRCADNTTLKTRAVLVATGLRDELPDIAGLRENWGSSILHCPYCHGYEVRDQPLAVVGGDNRPFSLHQASLVRQWSANVVFFPNRITLTPEETRRITARGTRIVEAVVTRVASELDGRTAIELDNGATHFASAVFVGPQFVPSDGLLAALGCERGDDGWVVTGPAGKTNVDGVWAAGNVSDSPAQLINAAAAGSTAGIAINHYLLEQDVQRALASTQTSR
jgi:thioredoxin reductase